MGQESQRIVQKLWSFCNVLRDDGLSYQDYLEQLTTLLFLKMAEERAELQQADELVHGLPGVGGVQKPIQLRNRRLQAPGELAAAETALLDAVLGLDR